MNRIITVVLFSLLLVVSSAYAQVSPIDKGSMQLGGGIGFAAFSGDLYENADGDGASMFTLNPRFGYFVIPSLLIGGEIDFTSISQGDVSQSDIGVGPMVAYYFDLDMTKTEVKGKIYPYLGASFLYFRTTFDSGDPGDEEVKWTTTTFSAKGGIAYMLSGAVAVFGEVVYDNDTSKQTDPVETDSESGSVIGVQVGITSFIW